MNRLTDDELAWRLLVEAVDEKAARLELESRATPEDKALWADLMEVWGLQAKLFGMEDRKGER